MESEIYRFATPKPLPHAIIPTQPLEPCMFSKAVMAWARHKKIIWVSHLRRVGKHSLLRCALAIPGDAGKPRIYLAPHIHGNSAHLMECQVPGEATSAVHCFVFSFSHTPFGIVLSLGRRESFDISAPLVSI